MKRFVALSLAVVLAISLAACGKPIPAADEPAPWNGLKNTASGEILSLGMTKEAAEALLGEGAELTELSYDESAALFSYGDGANYIVVAYTGELVTGLSTSTMHGEVAEAVTNWSDQYGIAPGASKALVLEKYGEGSEAPALTAEDGTQYSVREYFYDKDGNLVGERDGALYTALFLLNDSAENVVTISISALPGEDGMQTPEDPTDPTDPTDPADDGALPDGDPTQSGGSTPPVLSSGDGNPPEKPADGGNPPAGGPGDGNAPPDAPTGGMTPPDAPTVSE